MDDDFDQPGLDESGDYDSERRTRLDDFMNRLTDDPRTIIYDEMEWVAIADDALDVGNRFLFVEAVLWGLAAYPESRDLRDRETLLISDTINASESADAFRTLASRPHATRLTRLFEIDGQADGRPVDEYYASIWAVVTEQPPLRDHEVIEAVRLMSDRDALPLVSERLAEWERIVEYRQTLWYEIAATAVDLSRPDLGCESIERLVNEFPYNADYWTLKARIFSMLAQEDDSADKVRKYNDEAVDAVENALAIRPDDNTARALRGYINLTSGSSGNVGEDAVTATPDMLSEAIFTSVNSGNNDAVKRLLKEVPVEWFVDNMYFALYLSLCEINNDRAKSIIDAWLESSLKQYNSNSTASRFMLNLPECFADILYINDDYESVMDLYNQVEAVAVRLGCSNPLDLHAAYVTLTTQGDVKAAVRILERLRKRSDDSDVDVRVLQLMCDIASGDREMARDAYISMQKSENLWAYQMARPNVSQATLHFMAGSFYRLMRQLSAD